MDTTRFLLGVDLRRRWRSWLAVALLLGAVAAVALASVAGSHRTRTAFDRFVAYAQPLELAVTTALPQTELAALAEVDAVAGGDFLVMVPVVDGVASGAGAGSLNVFSLDTERIFDDVERPLFVAGSRFDPGAALEVLVDEAVAAEHGLGPGDAFEVGAYAPDQLDALFAGGQPPDAAGPRFTFTVTGVLRTPFDVVDVTPDQDVIYLGDQDLYVTPAFARAHAGRDVLGLASAFDEPGEHSFEVRLTDGADRAAFVAGVRALDPGARVEGIGDGAAAAGEAERATGLQATALLVLGALVAVVGVAVAAQALRRRFDADAEVRPVWSALGVDRRTVLHLAALRALLVGLVAALVAVAGAVALSPLAPAGIARRAEVDPGVDVDLAVLVPGALLVVLVVLVAGSLPALRPAVTRAAGARVGVADRLAQAGLPAPLVAGARAAAVSGGRRPATLAVLLATGSVVAGLTFRASHDDLARTPEAWGWTWDVVVGDGNDPGSADRGASLATRPEVGDVAAALALPALQVRAGTKEVELHLAGFDPLEGGLAPSLLEGAQPVGPAEVLLGRVSARALGVGLGDEITVDAPAGPVDLRVSGLTALNLAFDAERVGEGAVLLPPALEALGIAAEAEPRFVVRYADGVDEAAAGAALRAAWGPTVLRAAAPNDVVNLGRVRDLPLAFGLLLAVAAVVTLGTILAAGVRRTQRDLALLRTIGFTRRQLLQTVTAHAAVLAAPAALVGVVAGAAAGRLAWAATADGIGARVRPVLPATAALAVAVAAVAIAAALAVVPGRLAAAVRPASALRAE